MPLEITITNEPNNGKRVSLAGSLDTDTAPKLQTRIDESIDSSVTTLILDMKELEFLSSAGLGVIFMTKKVIGSRKGKIILLNLQPQVKRVFEIIKALDGMSIFKDREEMDAYLADMQQQVLDGE
ncbi:MAG: STAS domain-containing protein [Gammaproteobacteria bacterium]